MTATIKPATPLPWQHGIGGDGITRIYQSNKVICQFGYGDDEARMMHRGFQSNAAYIVAACNAYPRIMAERAELVAALRRIASVDVDATPRAAAAMKFEAEQALGAMCK